MFGLGMQADIAGTDDDDVGVVLRRNVRVAATRDHRSQTLGRKTAQIRIPGTGDGELKQIRATAALDVTAAMNGDLQLILVDAVQEKMP